MAEVVKFVLIQQSILDQLRRKAAQVSNQSPEPDLSRSVFSGNVEVQTQGKFSSVADDSPIRNMKRLIEMLPKRLKHKSEVFFRLLKGKLHLDPQDNVLYDDGTRGSHSKY